MERRSMQFGAALLALGGTIGTATAENRIDTQRPDAPELSAYGSHAVGVRTIEFSTPGQLNVVKINPKEPKPDVLPVYDRPLTVEVWYPAAQGASGDTALKAYLRDAKTEVELHGKGMRDAEPAKEKFPLVIVSHGYPGNRFLLSHLAENIASKGYVVASIDHTDSTYRTQSAFGSTLIHRPFDVKFTINQIDALSKKDGSFLNGLADADNSALIGYSMGGYGAVVLAGGGVTQGAVDIPFGGPHGTLGVHLSGSESHIGLPDPRIKTAIAFAPWGLTYGVWDADSLKGIGIPMMFVAGSVDDVSGYEKGTRAIWQAAKNVDRALLTFDNANHNAGAPIPAPKESFRFDKGLGFNISEHYTDAVWNSARMNNVSQHFTTAWLDKYLKSKNSSDMYLDLIPNANDGVWSVEKNGTEKPDHTHWKGFPNRTAKGLRFEMLKAGE